MDILEYLTSYHLINHLIPGSILSIILIKKEFFIKPEELISLLSINYFLGVIINRISSILVEPALKCFKIIDKISEEHYKQYCKNVKRDKKLEELSEVRNMYRIYLTLLIIVLVINILDKKLLVININYLILLGIILFVLAFRKQNLYISIRIKDKE